MQTIEISGKDNAFLRFINLEQQLEIFGYTPYDREFMKALELLTVIESGFDTFSYKENVLLKNTDTIENTNQYKYAQFKSEIVSNIPIKYSDTLEKFIKKYKSLLSYPLRAYILSDGYFIKDIMVYIVETLHEEADPVKSYDIKIKFDVTGLLTIGRNK